MPVVPFGWYPDVDILIATHNEETELLYKTVNGCRHMDYPDKSKVHIYICDDGNRPEMAELSKKMRVGYFGLADNKEAKAGNLNHAIGKTTSPWIVTFDSDMIPTHNFLMETVPYIFLPRMKKRKTVPGRNVQRRRRMKSTRSVLYRLPRAFIIPICSSTISSANRESPMNRTSSSARSMWDGTMRTPLFMQAPIH
ncbi:glycosyltransferase [[Clostridium] symbiosum]|uniref:glycosyltransferase n=1 Tax=Clostridium symbiosum TaxID=1512 RepID=UPI00214D08CE|nr:glycosyltransferase [[Clostridium] symbiosum]MCR1942606.1 glycosyltransferase [[Clostridium] symbiosum]